MHLLDDLYVVDNARYKNNKKTHTCLYFKFHVVTKQKGEQNFIKLQSVLLQTYLHSIYSFHHLYPLTPHQNTSSSLSFQHSKQCISWIMSFLSCDISVVPLQYIIRSEMWPVNAQLHCSNYIRQLHVSATK